jgi:hypothetical protein
MAKHYPTVEEKRQRHRAHLSRLEKGMGGIVPISFLPSNMAAGPCGEAARAALGAYDSQTVPIAPLDGCAHPDQCGCMLTIDHDRWLASQD